MATVKESIPHIIRTADDPRQQGVWTARISEIEQVNSKIRLLKLSLPRDGPPLRHLPGQYIDLYIPNVDVVGGFTITSPPGAASFDKTENPHIELAIQCSPTNPPAAYLWRPAAEILNSPVSFKVGGNFVYPPPTTAPQKLDRVVFVAGGVGINPIMSMVSAIHEAGLGLAGTESSSEKIPVPKTVRVLYTSRREKSPQGQSEPVLFEARLRSIADHWSSRKDVMDYTYTFFETSASGEAEAKEDEQTQNSTTCYRRINHNDLLDAIGPQETRPNTFVYVCGLPTMTDEFVSFLKNTPGVDERKVLCEKWW
ncbi:hypothetical protein ABEF95_016521 [Exophiala dermatitidis]